MNCLSFNKFLLLFKKMYFIILLNIIYIIIIPEFRIFNPEIPGLKNTPLIARPNLSVILLTFNRNFYSLCLSQTVLMNGNLNQVESIKIELF